jgi:membrane associated rhomboid family serine protease
MLGSVLGIYSALFLGPFLHNSAQHLVENLVVLFIAAGYLEYTSQPTHRVYQIYIITGWFGLFGAIAIGDPAVGASASASGLTACAGVVSYYHLYRAIQASVNKRSDLPGLYLHFIFISYFLVKNINYFITLNTRDGTTVSHAVGAAMGLVFGIYLLYSRRKTEKTL